MGLGVHEILFANQHTARCTYRVEGQETNKKHVYPVFACDWHVYRQPFGSVGDGRVFLFPSVLALRRSRSHTPPFGRVLGMLTKVWTSDGLWKGFLRCARMMAKESGATSFIAMVQLPDKTLKEALAHPLMKVNSLSQASAQRLSLIHI